MDRDAPPAGPGAGRRERPLRALATFGAILLAALAPCEAARAQESASAVICALIDRAAASHALPPSFLTRLLWRESSFRPKAISRAGAKGIAQFMPGTASERGLTDPFDPEAAIPASASYLAELRGSFGSLELAAAAYNAGPARISRWQRGEGSLPDETRAHVRFVTGVDLAREAALRPRPEGAATDCLATLADIRRSDPSPLRSAFAEATLPWGVQLVAGPNKERALADYRTLQSARNRARRPPADGAHHAARRTGHPLLLSHKVAFDRRAEADGLCRRMRASGASCLTVRNDRIHAAINSDDLRFASDNIK